MSPDEYRIKLYHPFIARIMCSDVLNKALQFRILGLFIRFMVKIKEKTEA